MDKHIAYGYWAHVLLNMIFLWYTKTRKFSVEMWRTSLSLSQSCHQLSNWTKRKTFKTKGQKNWNKQVDVESFSEMKRWCVYIHTLLYLFYSKHFVSAYYCAVKAFVVYCTMLFIFLLLYSNNFVCCFFSLKFFFFFIFLFFFFLRCDAISFVCRWWYAGSLPLLPLLFIHPIIIFQSGVLRCFSYSTTFNIKKCLFLDVHFYIIPYITFVFLIICQKNKTKSPIFLKK
jgi:hypothetical protein